MTIVSGEFYFSLRNAEGKKHERKQQSEGYDEKKEKALPWGRVGFLPSCPAKRSGEETPPLEEMSRMRQRWCRLPLGNHLLIV
ncbi:MAG: hypothetical protein IJT79_05580, partial [Ruminococcus sp.]|nr:hypothetical protein [Ruminococcus sp.]